VYTKEIETIRNFLKENVEVKKSLMLSGNGLRSQRYMQHIFFKRFSDDITQKLFELVLIHSEKAERLCSGAGILFLKKYANPNIILSNFRPTNLSELQQSIKDKKFSQIIQSLLLECLQHCKPTTKVNIKKSINQKIYLEINSRYSFFVDCLIDNKMQSGHDAKVILIDGYIENVSELHHIFQHFSTEEHLTPFLIFCRGMSNDVLSTISTNNKRGSFICHAFKVNFDLDNANTLVDIAVIVGGDVISSLKGELISSIDLTKIKKVDYFSRISQGITFKNSKNLVSIKQHINRLKLKSEDVTEDAKKYLYQRIKSLSSNSIDIALSDDINFYSHSQELDEGIRMIIGHINNGPDEASIIEELQKKLSMMISNIATIV
jgi:hypothetical protein